VRFTHRFDLSFDSQRRLAMLDGRSCSVIELPSEFAGFVQDRVARGDYSSPDDVLRAAFSLLEEREQLLADIKAGMRQLEDGEYTDYGPGSLLDFIGDIRAASARKVRPDGT
jgi:putative addiction module CopG family antidote